ncbi:hypothetical protein BDR26DRAFT_852703 [Obelidium mucronatum]|nr:hypothetical protein BDR26DRAFT_852703 [Obelidium mucronatum]
MKPIQHFTLVLVLGALLCLLGASLVLSPSSRSPLQHSSTQANSGTASSDDPLISSVKVSGLAADFLKFPIDNVVSLLKQNGSESKLDKAVADLIDVIVPYVIKDPLVPINASCQEPLYRPEDTDCAAYPKIFWPEVLDQPRRMAIGLQFGYDVDTLEIALHQYYNVFDHIFLVESMVTQHRKIRKPLIWEHIKTTPRFKKFADKVIHIVDHDATAFTAGKAGHEKVQNYSALFNHETHQEKFRWETIKAWNNKTGYYSSLDLIAFGDIDEIASLHNLRLLKHCYLRSSPVDIGIWFTMGRLTEGFASDFPIRGHPFTLGDPTFFLFGHATEYERVEKSHPTRLRGRSQHFLLGGAHLTNYGFLPYQMLRAISCSECGLDADRLLRWNSYIKKGKIQELELDWSRELFEPHRKMEPKRFKSIQAIGPEIVSIPWFLQCNLDRFPMWRGVNDRRIL